jgi:hypothetical protein
MRNVAFILLLVAVFGCKNDNGNNSVSPADMTMKPVTVPAKDPKDLKIPSACEMIGEAEIQKILNIAGASVNIKEADDPGNMTTRSCFFKWDDPATPNAGILIQILTNPVYSEYPEYISKFVSSKLTDGETMMGSDKPSIFKKFKSGNTIGAYSFEQGKAYWNLNNDYLFMLAFNVSTLSEDKMLQAAEAIVAEVNKNFATKASM